MDADIAYELEDLATDMDIELEVREGYSGRGMYGETTTGVVINSELELGWLLAKLGYDTFDAPRRLDNMGLRLIAY